MPSAPVLDVLLAFLRLGLTSFGGPIAHIAYFRTEFVQRRRWLDDAAFTDLVALCQLLPGPTSSQVGLALGLRRAGWGGALAAWIGFTAPSALALIAFGHGLHALDGAAGSGVLHGLKVVAVAIVAQAVWGMARSLCADVPRAAIAAGAALLTLALPATGGQLAAIAAAALLGAWWCRSVPPGVAAPAQHLVSRRAGLLALVLLAMLLGGLPLAAALSGSAALQLIDGVFRAGALVFGGGHVVLPLLESAVVPQGFVGPGDFLAGYGATQAVPGPLFTFAAYLGTVASGPLQGWLGGAVLLVAIFAPGFLLLVGALPFWDAVRRQRTMRSVVAGINAGVVGLLAAALYDPVWITAIGSLADVALALLAFVLLMSGRVSPVVVVGLGALVGWAMTGI
ncbi:MAG: chromate efflux transporter [Burkholderiales bacterium]|nr:chromate efflux transporter [Burkholderiales bacterium]